MLKSFIYWSTFSCLLFFRYGFKDNSKLALGSSLLFFIESIIFFIFKIIPISISELLSEEDVLVECLFAEDISSALEFLLLEEKLLIIFFISSGISLLLSILLKFFIISDISSFIVSPTYCFL